MYRNWFVSIIAYVQVLFNQPILSSYCKLGVRALSCWKSLIKYNLYWSVAELHVMPKPQGETRVWVETFGITLCLFSAFIPSILIEVLLCARI